MGQVWSPHYFHIFFFRFEVQQMIDVVCGANILGEANNIVMPWHSRFY